MIGGKPMQDGSDKREFSRAFVAKKVEITGDDGTVVSGQLKDVSVNGLFVGTTETLPIGAEYPVSILLETADGHAIELLMKGRITRLDSEGIAVQFTEIDADSLDHLRNLVMYNAKDPDQVEHELERHLAFRRPGQPES